MSNGDKLTLIRFEVFDLIRVNLILLKSKEFERHNNIKLDILSVSFGQFWCVGMIAVFRFVLSFGSFSGTRMK